MTTKIKDLRKKLGLNQDELATKAGISQSTLSDIENGKRASQIDTLVKLARALNVSITELIEEDVI